VRSRPLATVRNLVWLVAAAVLSGACDWSSAPAQPQVVSVTRPVGSWQGKGNQTIGLVSDSGRLRITWQTRHETAPRTGTFRLTVHSAVSGRPIQLVADHHGEGGGTADFTDDPRSYNLMVESTHVEWSITVDEIIAGYATPASTAPPPNQ
jgi:hypothetical protein